MKRFVFLLFAAILLVIVASCTQKKPEGEDCAHFEDYQFYPQQGNRDTLFELFVLLKDNSENEDVLGISADLLTSDGAETGKLFDLVRSDSDPQRWLRSFNGIDLCDEGTCNLFFNVVATHKSGCVKGFSTAMFQVVTGSVQPGDDTSDDDGDTADDTSDDTSSDDTAGDDTAG